MKSVLITGVKRGIGEALAKKFLAEGFFVIGTSTTGKSKLKHKNLVVFKMNLLNPKSIEKCTNKIYKVKMKINILVNNAGTWRPSSKDPKKNMRDFRDVVNINLIGPIDFTERLVKKLANGAHIINISSRQGSFAYPLGTSEPSYKISKAGLNMYTRVLSNKLKGKAIVSSVHPGAVLTDMAASDADMTAEDSADYIYKLAISKPKTGQFWFKGKSFPW